MDSTNVIQVRTAANRHRYSYYDSYDGSDNNENELESDYKCENEIQNVHENEMKNENENVCHGCHNTEEKKRKIGNEGRRGKCGLKKREVETGRGEEIGTLDENEQHRNLRKREEERREDINRETVKNSFEKEKGQIGLLGAIVHKLETLELKWNQTRLFDH